MLISLLPGLRELRTPLAAGYILVFTLYIALYREIDNIAESSLAVSVSRIASYFGAVGVAAAMAFVAFLVGSVWSELAIWLFIDAPPRVESWFNGRLSRYRHPSYRFSYGWQNKLRIWYTAKTYQVFKRLRKRGDRKRRLQDPFLRDLVTDRFKETYRSSPAFSSKFEEHATSLNVTLKYEGVPGIYEIEALINVDEHMTDVASDLLRLPVHLLGKIQRSGTHGIENAPKQSFG
jgi:hypothetical protein